MKLEDFAKLHTIIERIQAGHYKAPDVDNLLMYLRPYAGDNTVFLEVAHCR